MANLSKKNESVLGLPPIQSGLGFVPLAPERQPANREEERVLEAYHRQRLIIDLTAEKGEYGMFKLGEVQECATTLFGSTVSTIQAEKEQFRGTEAQPYVEEFTLRQIQMYAHHMLGSLDIVDTNIGTEIHRSLDLPPEKRGFLARLFGL